MEPESLSVGRGISMLLIGMPGVGKTPFIASGDGPTCIIHPPADNMDSVPASSRAKEIVVRDWDQMFEALAWANQLPVQEEPDVWVWLDSISVWQDYGVEDLLKDAIERKPSRAVERGETDFEVNESVQSFYVRDEKIMVPEFDADVQEYGINMKRIARWVRDMHGFAKEGKFNFGITAHPHEWTDPITEEDVMAPWIQGKGMITKICGYMNIIAYLQELPREGGPNQKVLFTKTPGFYGKDQFDCLPETKSGKRGLIDPTMAEFDELLAKSRGSGGSGARPVKKRKAKKAAKKAKKS